MFHWKFSRAGSRRVAVIAVTVGLLAPTAALAADTNTATPASTADATPPITINVSNGDVKSTLKALFGMAGVNYSIDPEVQGTADISLTNVSFLTALRTILHSTTPALTYSYSDGVYHVQLRQQQTPPADRTQPTLDDGHFSEVGSSLYAKVPVNHSDCTVMARLVANSDKPGVDIVPAASVGGSTGGGGAMGGVSVATAGGNGLQIGQPPAANSQQQPAVATQTAPSGPTAGLPAGVAHIYAMQADNSLLIKFTPGAVTTASDEVVAPNQSSAVN